MIVGTAVDGRPFVRSAADLALVRPGAVEFGIAGVVLFAYAGGLHTLLYGPASQATGFGVPPPLIGQAIWLAVYLVTLGLLRRRLGDCLTMVCSAAWLSLLLLLCPLSALWSIAPGISAWRGTTMLATAAFGFYLAIRFDHVSLMRLLAWTLGVVMLISLGLGAFWPEVGRMQVDHPGAWQGLFTHKNHLGIMALLDVVVVVLLLADGRSGQRMLVVALGLGLSMLLLSTALTPLVIALGLGSVVLFARIARASGLAPVYGSMFLLALVLIAGAGLLANAESLLGLIGRDLTLTGRTRIWSAAWDLIERNWLLGYGYGIIREYPASPILKVQWVVGYPTEDAHNGFLELWLELGLVGLTLFLLSLSGCARTLIARLRHEDHAYVYWTASYLAIFVMHNASESYALRHHDLFSVLFVATVVAGARLQWRAQPITGN